MTRRLPSLLRQQPVNRYAKKCKNHSWRAMVPGAGIEPARLAARDFESRASTNSTTRARAREGANYGTVGYRTSQPLKTRLAKPPFQTRIWSDTPGRVTNDSAPWALTAPDLDIQQRFSVRSAIHERTFDNAPRYDLRLTLRSPRLAGHRFCTACIRPGWPPLRRASANTNSALRPTGPGPR